MARRIRDHDWGATSLGAIAGWPSRLRAAVDFMLAAPVPISVCWGPEFVKLYNDAAIPIEPRHPRALGARPPDVYPESWDSRFAPLLEGVLSGCGAVYSREQRIEIERGGQLESVWFDFSLSPLLLEEGSVGGVLVMGTDVTAQRKTRLALAAAAGRDAFRVRLTDALRKLVEPRAIQSEACRQLGEFMGAQRVVYVDFQGHDFATVAGYVNGVEPFLERGTAAEFGEGLIADFRRGEPIVVEDVEQDPRITEAERGTYRFWQVRAYIAVVLVKEGDWVGAFGIHSSAPRRWMDAEIELTHDVAERIWAACERARAEEALRESEARFRVLIEAATQTVWETDAHGVVVKDSPSWRAYTGQSAEEWLGYGWVNAVHPDDRAYAESHWREATASCRSVDAEFRLRGPNGSWRWTNVRASPLRNPDGGIAKWVGMNLDVTERRAAEAALRENEARQSFLLELSDHIGTLAEPRDILAAATERLGRQLGLARVQYFRVEPDGQTLICAANYADGDLSHAAEAQRLSLAEHPDLVAALRAGREVVSKDGGPEAPALSAAEAPVIPVGSAIPLMKEGRLVAVLRCAHREPRRWTKQDRELQREVAVRSWAAAERVRAEAALRITEQQIRLAMQAATMFFWTADAEAGGRRNEAQHPDAVVGFEVEPRPFGTLAASAERILPEDRARLSAAVQGTLRGQGDLHLEYRVRDAEQGRTVWIETHGTRIVDPATGSARVVGVAQNIDQRKHAEQARRDGEERQAHLLALSDALRPLAEPLEIQNAASRLLGERLGASRAYFAEWNEEDGLAVILTQYLRLGASSMLGVYRLAEAASLVQVLRTGKPFVITDPPPGQTLAIEMDGVRKTHALCAQVTVPLLRGGKILTTLTVTDGTPRAWTTHEIALVQETVERTWAEVQRAYVERALRQSEQRLKRALSIDTVGVLFFTLEGEILDANRAFERMSGYSREELRQAVRWEALAPPEYEEVMARALRELGEHGETAPYEKQVIHRNGSRWWGLFAPTRLGGGGRSTECVEFVLDIGEQKRLQQQGEDLLAAATSAHAEAERANRAKDAFLATLSHELRTPLAAILLWASALRSRGLEQRDLTRAIEAIVQSAESQSRLIEDLLDLSRLTSGKFLFTPAASRVEDVALAAVDVVRPSARAKNIALCVDIPEDFGCAMLDAARFQQILWNLLSNATKFTPPGGHVTLRIRRLGGELMVEVIDTGVGIAPEFMPHIFERFRQADMGDTREHAGLGIGLALSQHLVELQGGSIEAHSEGLGRGAVFRLRLPWIEAGSPAAAPDAKGLGRAAGGPSLAGVTVLLVEDDTNTRNAMQWTLGRAGASVIAVRSGDEALAVLDRDEPGAPAPAAPNAVICDLGLPGMSGHQLLERIVQRCRARGERPLPVCAVSAHARDVDRQRAIAAGFDIYLPKPISPERLIEAVQDLRDVAAVDRGSNAQRAALSPSAS